MKNRLAFSPALVMLAAMACGSQEWTAGLDPGVTGTVVSFPDFESGFVAARNVDVWLPPGYDRDSTRYPVLYMHDGQNLFDPTKSYIGVDWGMDETMSAMADSSGRAAIIVGVWNTPRRFEEYMPQGIADRWTDSQKAEFAGYSNGPIASDDYLRFLVEELKPFVDGRFRTLSDAPNTMIAGSSMGGLISLYALTEFPSVFGAAACISTHWPVAGEAGLEYLRQRLPQAGRHRVYFDYGTEALDAEYEPWQIRVDELMAGRGYSAANWATVKFVGHDHSERSWRERAPGIVSWLMDGVWKTDMPELDRQRMLGDLEFLSSDGLGGRAVGSSGSALARERILASFSAAGLSSVREVAFDPGGDSPPGVNVLGEVLGTDPEAGYLVITAHYDHLGIRDGEVFNGADDNASGTAALMEMARHIARKPLRHSVFFAALDAEERGLRGARELVQNPPIPLERVVLNVNMDMVSRSAAGELYASGTYHYPALRTLLEPMVSTLPVTLLFGHDEPGTGSDDWTRASDHGPFHAEGIPFLYFGVEDHAGYHRPNDDFADITPDFYVGAVTTVYSVVLQLDRAMDGRVPPRTR